MKIVAAAIAHRKCGGKSQHSSSKPQGKPKLPTANAVVILSEAKDLWFLFVRPYGSNPRCFASLNMTAILGFHFCRPWAVGVPDSPTTAFTVSLINSHPLRRCSSVVSTFPRPIRITVRPHNVVCVIYARPLALIRSTISLFNLSSCFVVAGGASPARHHRCRQQNENRSRPC